MSQHEVSRTLVKSPPELWSECSEPAGLTRHLEGFGDIRITRLEPETAVAWEGEQVSGTVRLEPAGWGTRVVLTARQQAPDTRSRPPGSPSGLLARLRAVFRMGRSTEPQPASPGNGAAPGVPPTAAELALAAALDSLGSAHHRPFSRT